MSQGLYEPKTGKRNVAIPSFSIVDSHFVVKSNTFLKTEISRNCSTHSVFGSNAGKGKWSIYLACKKRERLHVDIKKAEIRFSKIGFMDFKWSELIAPGSYIPWSIHFWGLLKGVPFSVACPFLFINTDVIVTKIVKLHKVYRLRILACVGYAR